MRGTMKSLSFCLISTALIGGATSTMAADCGLKRITSVDTLASPNGSMLVPVKIGDAQRLLLFDTGGSISGITQPAAQELGLNSLESNIGLIGVGGAVSKRYTVLPSLTLGTVESKAVKFMILPGNTPMSRDNRVAGALAPNPNVDLDLDFAGKKLSMFSSDHCDGQVVYWPATAVAVVPMRLAGLGHIIIPVKLDGKQMDALIDTGASDTFLNLKVAEGRFDFRTDAPDVEPLAGRLAQNPSAKIYQRRFSTLAFEGVTVTNPTLIIIPDQMTARFGETRRTGSLTREADRGLPDLTLGMSVLGKTHLYVAYKERKVYITAASGPATVAPQPISTEASAQAAAPEVQLIPQDSQTTTPALTVKTPAAGAPSAPGAPILQSVTVRTNVRAANGRVIDVVPDFHFTAPNGNAIIIHRELVDTNGAISQTDIPDGTIRIPAEAQKKGAVLSGGWTCGKNVYYVTIRAFVMDSDGNRSNPMEYTIHCNGG
ncbi:MAG TPA: aspartyl protease family protein [Micropepsaceae bacterium]|nr:aspartyl protease family protein [Micropepsaceae bacterium]